MKEVGYYYSDYQPSLPSCSEYCARILHLVAMVAVHPAHQNADYHSGPDVHY